jgi:hypothetical protein
MEKKTHSSLFKILLIFHIQVFFETLVKQQSIYKVKKGSIGVNADKCQFFIQEKVS